MSSLQIGRLLLGPPIQWFEQFGDPVASLGGQVVPGPRTAPQFQATIASWAADGQTDTQAARLTLRRQIRSILNNAPLKLERHLYVIYSDDLEQDGWYVPDQAQVQDYSGSSGLATGLWQLSGANWYLAGHPRTHRDARRVWMKDLRTGLYVRDTLGLVLSTDFSALPVLQLSVLPNGATQAQDSVSGQVLPAVALAAGRDGGIAQLVTGLGDLTVASYERPESARNLSDVIAYDRRGQLGPFGTGGNNTYAATVTGAAGLLAYWRLQETSGTSAADSKGTDTGTYTGAPTLGATGPLTVAPTDTGVTFNGSTQYVTASSPTSAVDNFAIECWMKAPASNSAIIVAAANSTSGSDGWGLGFLNNLTLAGLLFNVVNVSSGYTFTDTNWHHVVMTRESGTLKFYVDGVQTSGTSTSTPVAPGASFTIAAQVTSGNFSRFFPGSLSEVAVYNQALSATTVAAHYAARLAAASTYDTPAGLANPQTAYGWQEMYGPDWPYNWQTAGQPPDAPTLENGLCRVRYDQSAGVPGFRVDVWNGATYVEQGKLTVYRNGDSFAVCTAFVSASLVEWTPDRAVLLCVLAVMTDAYSRERVYITMTRGVTGCRFEYYSALKAAGGQADAILLWGAAAADVNGAAVKIDSQAQPPAAGAGVIAATAGSGSSAFPGATLGAASFATSENDIALLRCSAAATVTPYQASLAVVQAAGAGVSTQSDTSGYGVARNALAVASSAGAGYISAHLSFAPTAGQQIMEAESMTLGTGTVSSADAAASGGFAATATRTTDANAHATQASWPNGTLGKYRVFARVKVSANTGSFYAKTGASTGTTVTTTSTGYMWLDLGDMVASNTTLEIHAWIAAGGTVSVDRVEAVLLSDLTGAGRAQGMRDLGQSALTDSRALGTLTAR